MNLLSSMIDDLLENKSNDIRKLLSQRIKIYTISDSSHEISVKLSNDGITDILKRNKNLPNQPFNKQIKYDIKISNHDQDPLWLNVDHLMACFVFDIYHAVSGSNRVPNIDLNTGKDLYYAFDESTPKFKKQPTNEGAIKFCFSVNNPTNLSINKRKCGNTLRDFLLAIGEFERNDKNITLAIKNALNDIIGAYSKVEWEISEDKLFDIKNILIRPKEEELSKLVDYVVAMQIIIKNPRLNNMKISMKIDLNNNGSKSTLKWIPMITDMSKTKLIYDYLFKYRYPTKKWRNLSFGYLCLLMMPQLLVVQVPGNVLDFQLDGILISKVTDVKIKITDPGVINGNPKIKITDPGVINGNPKIIIKACASIRDIKSVNILTQNDNMQSLIMEFDTGTTLTQIAKAINVSKNTYDKLNVPLYDMPLSVIEVKDATIDLEHNDAKWIGKIKSIAKIIGKQLYFACSPKEPITVTISSTFEALVASCRTVVSRNSYPRTVVATITSTSCLVIPTLNK
ncbi:2852_t:CDS:2 [Racocetra persica]|uniref:2852_t:CDS:1 n=1 Tax=Racocetra persica TaxID=160502 RepID=A0ACA9LN40_9GLOM|nr:2852_t:CDS:2 [Racocetra persica]